MRKIHFTFPLNVCGLKLKSILHVPFGKIIRAIKVVLRVRNSKMQTRKIKTHQGVGRTDGYLRMNKF